MSYTCPVSPICKIVMKLHKTAVLAISPRRRSCFLATPRLASLNIWNRNTLLHCMKLLNYMKQSAIKHKPLNNCIRILSFKSPQSVKSPFFSAIVTMPNIVFFIGVGTTTFRAYHIKNLLLTFDFLSCLSIKKRIF